MKSLRFLLSTTILLSMLAGSALAAPTAPDSPDSLGTLTRIGILESGKINDLAVQGNYAYAGFGSTLVVIDISDPANMQRVTSLSLAGEIKAIEADQDYLYVSSLWSGLWIVDIQNPLAPVKTGFYPSQSSTVLAVQGDSAYVHMDNGLTIIDISARDAPKLAGLVNDSFILTDIAVKDKFLYLAELGSRNIRILDISSPAQPVYSGQYTPGNYIWSAHIEISNSTLYYVDDSNGFQILDITVPAEPKLIGSLSSTDHEFKGLALSDDRVYLTFKMVFERQGGFEIIDASDPSNPKSIGTYTSIDSFDTTSIAASGGNVFLTRTGEVQSIDASLPSAPTLVDSLESSLNEPNKIAIAGDFAYIIDFVDYESSRLRIVDIADPYQPSVTGQLPLPSTLTDVEVSGNIAIVTQATDSPGISSVYFIDVSDPKNPAEVGRFDSEQVKFRGAGVEGEYAYITWDSYDLSEWAGVYVLNIADPTNPHMVGFYELLAARYSQSIADVILVGDYAYIPYVRGLLVLDIHTPEEPVKAGELDGYSFGDIALAGDLAYLAHWPGVILLDVSDPANPVEIITFDYQTQTSGVIIQNNFLHISSDLGLFILDVTQPTTPNLAAFLPSMRGQDVSIQGREIFYTSSEGFQILHLIGTISGVVQQPNRMPVSGVTITANSTFSDTTTSTGVYTFEGLEPGGYTITPSLAEFTFTPQQVQTVVPPNAVANFTLLPIPVSAELTPGITTTLTYTDVQGLPTSFLFPAGSVSTTTSAYVTPTLATEPFGSAFAGHAFDLALLGGETPARITTFPAPVSVAIHYSPQDTAVISDTASLALYWLDEGIWKKADDSCIIPGTPPVQEPGIFRNVICRQGQYALFGATHAVALPQVSYGSDTSQVILPLTH